MLPNFEAPIVSTAFFLITNSPGVSIAGTVSLLPWPGTKPPVAKPLGAPDILEPKPLAPPPLFIPPANPAVNCVTAERPLAAPIIAKTGRTPLTLSAILIKALAKPKAPLAIV